MALKSTGIRLEGTPEQIEEALKRLGLVFEVSNSRMYESRRGPETFLCYCRLYVYADRPTLADQLWACQQQVQELQEQIGEASFEIQRLRDALNLEPKPQPFDVVLGDRRDS